jgi:hypothetical protein
MFACTVFPMAHYFEPSLSLESIAEESTTALLGRLQPQQALDRVFLFTPLGVSSFDTTGAEMNSEKAASSGEFGRAEALCRRYHARGIYNTVRATPVVLASSVRHPCCLRTTRAICRSHCWSRRTAR